MKLAPELKYNTSPEWVEAVMKDFNSFLQDHADCERKASAMAMSFVAKCPDKTRIIPELIETAIEELEHFQQVYGIMQSRGVPLVKEMKQDRYMKELIDACRTAPEERLLDRMLLASIVECRGAERFKLVYEALPEGELKKFYHHLWASEAKHGNLFIKLALEYFAREEVENRIDFLVEKEAEIISKLPARPALH